MVLRPPAPCQVVGMELKDLGLLPGHLVRDSTPCRMAGMEIKDPGHLARDSYLGLLGGH